jgi:hypothetical protein
MSIAQLQPANQQDVRIYMPYFQGNKRNMLPLAISLYKKDLWRESAKLNTAMAFRSLPPGMYRPYPQISLVAECSLMAMQS